jgi:uncharacterized GH25 family protein
MSFEVNRSLQWKLIAGFILVFVAGAMTGVFFASAHAHHIFIEFHQPDLVSTRTKERLKTELNLTPEQEAKIAPMVDKMAAQLEQIRMETGRRVHQTFMDAHREMAASLTEEQRGKLKQMEEQRHSFHLRHGGRGPSPEERPPSSP